MDNKEQIKNFLRESLGITDENDLEEFSEKLILKSEKYDALVDAPRGRIWKKEEIEALGIEVTPVKWKKLD